ncbi:DMT family transporter [Fredinandcohnia sp. FSL W7-1320]|uniref:DMT family transporter n=1 Tax=Fredinandcohnia sp. FSL W7-1320 TaxID=2954540 RepID=UPI0030FDEFA1
MKQSYLYLLLTVMMAIWGFNVIAVKIVVSEFPPVTITAIRVFIAFLALVPFIIYKKLYRKLTRKEWFYVIGISTFGIFGFQYFMSVGLNFTTATNAGIILGAAPIATAIGAAIFLNDKFTLMRALGFVLGFIGVFIIILAGSNEGFSISMGDLYLLIAVIVQTVSFVLIKKVSDTLNTTYMTGITLLVGSLILMINALITEPNGISQIPEGSAVALGLLIFSGFVATGLAYLIVNAAIHRVGAGNSAIFLNLSPFFAVISAYFVLHESIYLSHWAGFGLIVAGVLLGTGYGQFKRNRETTSRSIIKA